MEGKRGRMEDRKKSENVSNGSKRKLRVTPTFAGLKVSVYLKLGVKAPSFRLGMKHRPLGKDQNTKIYLTFSPNCGTIKTITLADMQSIVA